MPEQGLRKEASAPHVWKHAVTQSKSDGSVYKRVAGSAMSPEQRAALIIGRRWRARTALRSALRRSRLIERLQLESSVSECGGALESKRSHQHLTVLPKLLSPRVHQPSVKCPCGDL